MLCCKGAAMNEDELSFADMLLRLDALHICLMVGIPFVATFSEINFSLGQSMLGSIEFVMMLSLSMLAWLLWCKGSRPVYGHLFLGHAAVLFGLLYFLGGFGGIGFIWSLGFPYIACLVVGSVAGGMWSLAYLLALVAVGFFVQEVIVQTTAQLLYIVLAYTAMSLIAYCAAVVREAREARMAKLEGRLGLRSCSPQDIPTFLEILEQSDGR
ncbi:MAG: hypothetical protein D6703_07080 [Zetaproteobacteria bacterium]|nr:MAG: hypothetical protein D6703_07080 [Zetaproteobacteria bacterium]